MSPLLVDVGRFAIVNGKLEFGESQLRVPLEHTLFFGRAQGGENDLDYVRLRDDRIIIPHLDYGANRDISRKHGAISELEDRRVVYDHLSASGMQTTVFQDGVVQEVLSKGKGSFVAPAFPDLYLLLGGEGRAQTVVDRFLGATPYYLRVFQQD